MEHNDTTRFLSFKGDFVNDVRKAIAELKNNDKFEIVFSNDVRKIGYAEYENRYLLLDDNNGVTSVYQDMHYLPGRKSLDVKDFITAVKENPSADISHDLPLIVRMKNEFSEIYSQDHFERFMAYAGKHRSLDEENNNPMIVKYLSGKIGKNPLSFNHDIGFNYLQDRLHTSSSAVDVYDLVKVLESFDVLKKGKYDKEFFLEVNKNYGAYLDSFVANIVEDLDSIAHGLHSLPNNKKDQNLWMVDSKYIVMIEHESILVAEKTGDWGYWNVYQTKHDSATKFLNNVISGKADKLEHLILEVDDYFTVSATESYVHRFELAIREIVEGLESQKIIPDKDLNRKLN